MSELSLSEEFSAAAERFKKSDAEVTLPLLLTQFSVLMRHKLTENADKDAVTAALFDCGMDMINSRVMAVKPVSLNDGPQQEMAKIFSRVLQPECADHIPAYAANSLATATLDIVRKGEATAYGDCKDRNGDPNWTLMEEYKTAMAAIAGITLSFADQCRETLEKSSSNVTTGSPVTMSKPLSLKTRENAPA